VAEQQKKKMHPLGCLALFVVVVGVVLGIGMLLANRDDAKRTPCERYARTVWKALDNCHSGVNRSHKHHVQICEARVNATDKCLKKVRSLSCNELERGVAASAGDACAKE